MLQRLVKIVLAVNRFDYDHRFDALVPAPTLFDDGHYVIDWRGFWSPVVERLTARVNGVKCGLPVSAAERVGRVATVLGPLAPREIDWEIAKAFSRALGVPVILDHIIGARVVDLAREWPPKWWRLWRG